MTMRLSKAWKTEGSSKSKHVRDISLDHHDQLRGMSNIGEDHMTSMNDGATCLLSDMKTTIRDMHDSTFFKRVLNQLRTDPDIQRQLRRVFGSNSNHKAEVIIYNLGSIELSYISQCHLSLMVLLRTKFDWVGDIKVYDASIFTPLDVKVMAMLGCTVIPINGQHCPSKVVKPTLIFIPCPNNIDIMLNFLKRNWFPAQLNHLIILSDYKFRISELLPQHSLYHSEHYKQFLDKYASSFKLNYSRRGYKDEAIYKLFWSFFNVEFGIDMDTSLPVGFTMERRLETQFSSSELVQRNYKEARILNEKRFEEAFKYLGFRNSWDPTQAGTWTKLDFSGEGHEREENSRTMCLVLDMQANLKDMSSSKYFRIMIDQLQQNIDIWDSFERVLDANQKVQVIIYGLGSLEQSHISQCQLSLMAALQRKLYNFGKIKVFDPALSPIDYEVIEKYMEWAVLSVNENFAVKVVKPTLFFVPYSDTALIVNILQANWSSAEINHIILFCDSDFNTPEPSKNNHFEMYRGVLCNYASSFKVNTGASIGEFFLTFFNVDSHIDMKSQLPDPYTMKRRFGSQRFFTEFQNLERIWSETAYQIARECLGFQTKTYLWQNPPFRVRRSWQPPQHGWLKLNFSGQVHGHGRKMKASYGGIFHDEFQRCVETYSGKLGGAIQDSKAASLEALRQGLVRFMKLNNSAEKGLVVEGDDFSVIRWITLGPEPPREFREAVLQVSDLLRIIKPVVYHVYKEANSEAIRLSGKGDLSFKFLFC